MEQGPSTEFTFSRCGTLRWEVLRPDLDRRKLPEPAEETVGWSLDQEQLAVRIVCHQHRVGDRTHTRSALRGRPQLLRPLGPSQAFPHQRTFRAPRGPAGAYRGSQLHERLIPIPGTIGIDELAGSFPQARVGGIHEVEESGQNAPHVSIHGGHNLPVGDARDGTRAVLADPRQRLETPGVLRKHPAEPIPHDQGRAPKIPGPRIIAESFPCLQHGLYVRLRKILHRGKALHPPVVIRNRGLYTRLLEHDLGDPDAVWLPTRSPRKVTAMLVVVLQEEASESVRIAGGRAPTPRAP